jgi:hypothetical protein
MEHVSIVCTCYICTTPTLTNHFRMRCRNCHVSTRNDTNLCAHCSLRRECIRCFRRLCDYSFENTNVCISCSHRPSRRTAMMGLLTEETFPTSPTDIDFDSFIATRRDLIVEGIRQALSQHTTIKIFFKSDVRFHRYSPDGDLQTTEAGFRTHPIVISSTNDLTLKDIAIEFGNCIEQFNSRGSCWHVSHLLSFVVCHVAHRPLGRQ